LRDDVRRELLRAAGDHRIVICGFLMMNFRISRGVPEARASS
jgi:hypothetical protein